MANILLHDKCVMWCTNCGQDKDFVLTVFGIECTRCKKADRVTIDYAVPSKN